MHEEPYLSKVYDNKDSLSSELVVRSIAQALLTGFISNISSEKANAFGRSDLEFDFGQFHYVMEFKYASSDNNADCLLLAGSNQVQQKLYGKQDLSGKTLKRIVLVYSKEKHQIIKSKLLD